MAMAETIADTTRDDVYLTSRDLTHRYRIVDRTLARWLEDSKLDFPQPVFIRGRRYFPRAAVEAWERARALKNARAE